MNETMNTTSLNVGTAASSSTDSSSPASLSICLENPSFYFVSHIGFSLLGASYLMRDPALLRICIGVSNMVLICWGLLALPAWSCLSTVLWNGLFMVINLQRWVAARREKYSKKLAERAAHVAGDRQRTSTEVGSTTVEL